MNNESRDRHRLERDISELIDGHVHGDSGELCRSTIDIAIEIMNLLEVKGMQMSDMAVRIHWRRHAEQAGRDIAQRWQATKLQSRICEYIAAQDGVPLLALLRAFAGDAHPVETADALDVLVKEGLALCEEEIVSLTQLGFGYAAGEDIE